MATATAGPSSVRREPPPSRRGAGDPDVTTRGTLMWLGVALLLGVLAVVLLPLATGMEGVAGIQLMVAAAATAVGLLLGFLFGVPRTLQPSDENGGGEPLAYRFNTNLEQISDWLTKILVGVGLTQLTAVGPAVRTIAEVTVEGVAAPTASALVAAGLLYFVVLGFLIGYLWTRLVYPGLLVAADTGTHMTLTRYLRSLEQKITDTAEGAMAAVEHGVGGGAEPRDRARATGSARAAAVAPVPESEEDPYDLPPVSNPEDPARGRFGGRSQDNGRRLTADVDAYPGRTGWFRVQLEVRRTEDGPPLSGTVRFYVHHTFKNPVFEVPVENGVARAVLVAWGAFTVGAVADEGDTRLELNLAELPGAPRRFREN